MDSFEWNKVIGGVLGSVLLILAIRVGSEFLFEVEEPAKPGYVVEGVEEASAGGPAAPAVEKTPDWGTVLASADVAAGKEVSGKCMACHDIAKGGANKIGPELYGVVGRARASNAGFSYSSGMKAKGGNWTLDDLFHFLKSPGAFVNGTKMSFAGIRSEKDRINLIAYLRTESDSPVPIPAPLPAAAPEAAPAAAPAAPAEAAPAAPAAPAGEAAPKPPGQ